MTFNKYPSPFGRRIFFYTFRLITKPLVWAAASYKIYGVGINLRTHFSWLKWFIHFLLLYNIYNVYSCILYIRSNFCINRFSLLKYPLYSTIISYFKKFVNWFYGVGRKFFEKVWQYPSPFRAADIFFMKLRGCEKVFWGGGYEWGLGGFWGVLG